MNALPRGWATTTLGEICSKPQYGWTSKASRIGRIKYLRTTDISSGQLDWNDVPFCELEPSDVEKFRVREDDILVSRAGSVGVSFRIKDVPDDAVFASYLIRFNPLKCALPKYVEYFLQSYDYWRAISESSAGIAIPNVNASKLAELRIPLSPLREQSRIVAKLDKVLSRVDAAQARLVSIPRILKRFRESVLGAACLGQLTAAWREKNPQLDGAPSRFKEGRFSLSSSEDSLADLPETWAWVPLGNYAQCFRGKFTPRPRNDPRYFNGPHPFIQIGNLPRDGGFVSSHTQTLNDAGLAVSRKFPKGTPVIAIVGATIGNTGVLAYDMCVTGLREFVHVRFRFAVTRFEFIGGCEQRVDATDDFFLFGQGRQCKWIRIQKLQLDIRLTTA